MPTARPSIAASVGVVDDSSVNPVVMVIPRMPMPTPIAAVSRFMPAVTSEPYVTARTTSASTTPTASAGPPTCGGATTASPVTSTVSPVPRAWSTAASSASCCSTVTSPAGAA